MSEYNTEHMFISRWSDFGMNYRGKWTPTNTYKKNDVVWIDLGEAKLGSETYFVCQEEHRATGEDEVHWKDPYCLWEKWG